MTSIPTFRTFVNAFGINTRSILFPLNEIELLHAPVEMISYWYWCLCRLTFDYTYTINDFSIHHHTILDGTCFTLKDRIQGGWIFELPKITDAELDITTQCKFFLCHIQDPSVSRNFKETFDHYMHLLEVQPTLCKDPLFPLDKNFYLSLQFQENAINGDFRLHTVQQDHSGICLHSIQVPFMNQTMPLYLTTPYPKEITGSINYFSVTPEFFDIAAT